MFFLCSHSESGAISAERQQEQEPAYPTDADAREAVRILLSDLEGWRGITTRRYRTASSTAAWPWSAAGQVAPMNSWVHQVELRLDRQAAGDRLRRMESWCGDWQIGMRVIEKIEPGTVRVAFDEPRFARTFVSHFGGVIVPMDEVEPALHADAAAEDGPGRPGRAAGGDLTGIGSEVIPSGASCPI